MKKCIRCTKPATLHITDIREGQVHALHLCESCAHDYLSGGGGGSSSPTGADALAEKFAEEGGGRAGAEYESLVCPSCGMSYADFRGEGRLGCPHDYTAFEAELMPLIENIHGSTQHEGKCPRRAPDASRRQYELIKLRSELRAAVENEEYETAAGLRDQIQDIESTLGSDVSAGE